MVLGKMIIAPNKKIDSISLESKSNFKIKSPMHLFCISLFFKISVYCYLNIKIIIYFKNIKEFSVYQIKDLIIYG